jgi:threonine dehydratase
MSAGRLDAAEEYGVRAARDAIQGIAVPTPVLESPPLAARVNGAPSIFLKLENLQVTGSFKVRGAANKILSLTEDQRAKGVVACSSGNHGKAVAYVAGRLGIPATVCVPVWVWVDPVKLEAIRRYGAEAVVYGKTYDEAVTRSEEIQHERGLVSVHPFDDPRVIAGQGTIGLELLEQVPSLDTVLVPLSGGGLIAGIAVALRAEQPNIGIVGVSAENARVMYASLQVGHPIEYPEEETIASALSGGIGLDNHHTFRLVRDFVNEHVIVEEGHLKEAMAFCVKEHHMIVEGGGAAGIAALLAGRVGQCGDRVAVVVSGGNIDLDLLMRTVS